MLFYDEVASRCDFGVNLASCWHQKTIKIAPWRRLGASWVRLGAFWTCLWASWGGSWAVLGYFGGVLEASWASWARLGVVGRGPGNRYGLRRGATRGGAAKNPLQGAPGPPPLREKRASYNTQGPKPGAMLDALTRPGPKGPANLESNFEEAGRTAISAKKSRQLDFL